MHVAIEYSPTISKSESMAALDLMLTMAARFAAPIMA
jgi:hypothetical protein